MNYVSALETQLVSPANIEFMMSRIVSTFKIKLSQSNRTKCINILISYFQKYMLNIERFPTNSNEFLDAVKYLNDKCFEDFSQYLARKYPGVNVLRNEHRMIETKPVSLLLDTSTNSELHYDNTRTEIIDVTHTATTTTPTPNVAQSISPITVITAEEKDRLIRSANQPQKPELSDTVIDCLMNPWFMRVYQMIRDEESKTGETKFSEIISEKELQELLHKKEEPKTVPEIAPSQKPTPDIVPVSSVEKPNDSSDKDKLKEIELTLQSMNDPTGGDPTSSVTKLQKQIPILMEIKDKYMREGNKDMLETVEHIKKQILERVTEHKKKCKMNAADAAAKILNVDTSPIKITTETDDKIVTIKIQVDPNVAGSLTELKNIVVSQDALSMTSSDSSKPRASGKISTITLHSYNVPKNEYNITRLNNKFHIFFNENLNRISIPPGKYDIKAIVAYLKNQASYLALSIDDDGIVTIKNTMSLKFDLMLGSDSIFPMLGFTETSDTYRDSLVYTGKQKHNMTANDTIMFSLSGTSMDPMPLESDKEMIVNKVLKKSKAGIMPKQLTINFTDALDQQYDFTKPYCLSLQLEYL